MKKLISILAVLLFLIGCQSPEGVLEKELKPITLAEAYPGDITKVNKVELLDGSTGERKIVDDQAIVQEWLNQIKNVKLLPDENQEQRVGYIFGITLLEGDIKKLGFISYKINNLYYKTNEQFEEPIKAFFEDQFGRPF